MKTTFRFALVQTRIASLITVCLAVASGQLVKGAQFIWSGASGTDLNWITPGNWSPSGPPGAADDAQFFDPGAASDTSTIDNIVSAGMGVNSLWYGQTNGVHNTLIDPGATLTLSGASGSGHALLVGTETQPTNTEVVTATISGPGGTLVIDSTNADILIRQTHSSSGSHSANLDLSGLDVFSGSLGRMQVGVGNTTLRRATGNLTLARTNTLTLVGSSPQLLVSDNSGNNNGNGTLSSLTLGMKNSIFADTARIGGQKCAGAMSFGSQTGSLYMRGTDGISPVSEIDVGDDSSQSGSGNPSHGTLDLSGGTADILADTMYVGRGQHGSGGGGSYGTVMLGAGTLNVNSLELAYQNAANAVGTVSGTMTVGSNGLFSSGAILMVSNLDMGHSAGSAAAIDSTLNIGGGTVDVLDGISFGGTATVNVTNGLLNLPAHSSVLASVVTVDGGLITNVDVLQASNTLVVVNHGIIASPKLFDMGNSGLATWDLSGSAAGGLVVSNSFSGIGTFYGNLTMEPGSVLSPYGAGLSPLYINNNLGTNGNLTLNGAAVRLGLSNNGLAGNDQLYVYNGLTLSGTNQVRITPLNSSLDTVNPYVLMYYYGALSGGANNLQVGGAVAQSRYTFSFSTATPNEILLSVGGNGPANLLWTGNPANTWDLTNTVDWNNAGSPDKFYNLDNVTFDDTGSSSPAVNLTGTLIPGSITMSNNAEAYTFDGTGNLGGGSLTNYGAGGLTIRNGGTNDFNMIDVENGNLTFAGGSANFSDGGLIVGLSSGLGSVTIANTNANAFGGAGIYINNGSLIFDQPADAEFSTPIVGSGTLIKTNANTLTMSGDNSGWSSALNVVDGTVKVGVAAAVENSGGVFVTGGSALDLNGQNLTPSSVMVTASGTGPGGTGAIVNNGPDQVHAFTTLTLAGDTTFGGSGRWDLRGTSSSLAILNLNGGGYNITKTGTNQVALVYCAVDPTLGNIDVQQGEFSIQEPQTAQDGMGDPSKTITVHSGATLETWALGAYPLNKLITLQDGAIIQNDSSASIIGGQITLQGNAWVNDNHDFTFADAVSGNGGLTLLGGSTLVLSAANSYAGATVVSNGTLQVDGVIGGSGVDAAGGTVSGIGSIVAPVTVATNGTLSPGDGAGSIGTLSIAGTVSLAGVNQMDVNKTNGVVTSDLVTNISSLTIGGTLQLNLTGDALTNGDAITLYSAGTITGSFGSIVPATPGTGLAWDTSALDSQGILKVTAAAPAPPIISGVSMSNGNVMFNVTGGNAGAALYVLTSTNLAQPLANWTPVTTNQFDSNGNFSFTNAVSGRPRQFFIIQQQ